MPPIRLKVNKTLGSLVTSTGLHLQHVTKQQQQQLNKLLNTQEAERACASDTPVTGGCNTKVGVCGPLGNHNAVAGWMTQRPPKTRHRPDLLKRYG